MSVNRASVWSIGSPPLALRAFDGDHHLAALWRTTVAGVYLARLEAEESDDEHPGEKLGHEDNGRPL